MASNKKNQQKSDLGKFAGMSGTIFKSEVAPAKPIKGIVGKGLPHTCNASISEQMSARSLRQHKLEMAEANGEQVNEDELLDEMNEDEDGGENTASVA